METTRAGIAIYKINYQSDFILTVVCDVEWGTPFCIKFWTGEPSQAYYVGWDGNEYRNCKVVESDQSKLLVLFDDHHLPVGELKMQIAYHTTIDDFPNAIVDEVTNSMKVMAYIDGKNQKVALDFEGEEAAELQFELPAYANEAQRIANEEQRIANEQARIEAEQQRIDNEQTRQNNEAQRIAQETARVNEYAGLKADVVAATTAANDAATLATQQAQLAVDKAALADAAATLANQKAQLAADKAALADAAATLANQKAALAQQKAEYADAQGDYAKEQGDYAKEQGDTALADHRRAESDHETAASDHTQAGNDHTRAESDHSTAADDHTLAASDHSTAAEDHTLAASDHSTAADDHTLAASDHSTAANDHTQAGNDHTRAESDHTRAESDHAAVEVYVDSLGAFDISSYHATGGVLAKYADLTAALGTNGANIPEAIRKGGMSVKFVQSSDNKYMQWRYMGTAVTGTPNPFLDAANWQGVDEEIMSGSKNVIENNAIAGALGELNAIYNVDKSLTAGAGVISAVGYIITNHIEIIQQTITWHHCKQPTQIQLFAFGSNKQRIDNFGSNTSGTERQVNLPAGTAYIMATFRIADLYNSYITDSNGVKIWDGSKIAIEWLRESYNKRTILGSNSFFTALDTGVRFVPNLNQILIISEDSVYTKYCIGDGTTRYGSLNKYNIGHLNAPITQEMLNEALQAQLYTSEDKNTVEELSKDVTDVIKVKSATLGKAMQYRNLINATGYCVSDKIACDITSGDSCVWFCNCLKTDTPIISVVFYDEDDEVINTWDSSASINTDGTYSRTYDYLTDAAYIVISGKFNADNPPYFKVGTKKIWIAYLEDGEIEKLKKSGRYIYHFNIAQWNMGNGNEGHTPAGIPDDDVATKLPVLKQVLTKTCADFFFANECPTVLNQGDSGATQQDFYTAVMKQFYPYKSEANTNGQRIFSKMPVLLTRVNVTLPDNNSASYMYDTLTINNKEVKLVIIHGPVVGSGTEGAVANRVAYFTAVVNAFSTSDYVIMAGDTNIGNNSESSAYIEQELAVLQNAGYALGNRGYWGAIPTMDSPAQALDNIMVKGFNVDSYEVLDDKNISDHYPTKGSISAYL